MTRHDDLTRLRHMRDHAQEAVALVQGRSRSELDLNRMLELALVRLVEIVGEAGARVSETTRNHYPQIPWRQVVGMRNRIVHGYDEVDLDVLWDTAVIDFPTLLTQLGRILDDMEAK